MAVVRGLEGSSKSLTIVLYPPDGVEVLDGAERVLGRVEANSVVRVEWAVKAEAELGGSLLVALRDEESGLYEPRYMDVRFDRAIDIPVADYVPEPTPAKTSLMLLAHHCPLWKYGAHAHGWDTIGAWPERKPAIGFYDEGDPVVSDWHIKYALEHGIQGFIFVWDKTLMNPLDKNSLAASIDDGFLNARFQERFGFCLNWTTNYVGHNGVRDATEVLDEILPYWIEKYFKRDNYVKIDGRPVLFVTQPDALCEQLGGATATRAVVDEMRARMRAAGFAGLTLVGCVPCAKPGIQERMARSGYDASSSYDIWTDGWQDARSDREGIPAFSHRAMMAAQRDVLLEKKQASELPDITSVHVGWDSRPWHGKDTVYYMAEPSSAAFELACRNAKEVFEATHGRGIDTRLIVINNWNEFGEGHYIAPTAGFGFSLLDVVRRVFTEESGPCDHLIPEDVGLEPPDSVYRACRGILGSPYGAPPVPDSNLVAWWRFDEPEEHVARDTSGNGFDGFIDRGVSEAGFSGHALGCQDGGTMTLATNAAFYPSDGFSIELWCKPSSNQPSVFLLNCSSEPHTGYGLALEAGIPTFYLNWSHRVRAPLPLVLDTWSHIVAVSDNRDIALFVDGVEVARERGAPVERPTKGAIALGAYSGTGAETFLGALDEVRILRGALTTNEVAERYEARR